MLLVMSTEHVILVGIGPGVLQSVRKVTIIVIIDYIALLTNLYKYYGMFDLTVNQFTCPMSDYLGYH